MSESASLDRLTEALLARHPEFSPGEREVGLALYRQIGRGEPVRRERMAKLLGKPAARVVALLESPGLRGLVLYDDHRRVIGFGGLSIRPTANKLAIGDRTLYTWCAWDSLFIPPLLAVVATAEAACPVTGQCLSVVVSPSGVRDPNPETLRMTFVTPACGLCCTDPDEAMATFCSQVRFVASTRAGERWLAARADGYVLDPEHAFELGARLTRFRWGSAATVTPTRVTSA